MPYSGTINTDFVSKPAFKHLSYIRLLSDAESLIDDSIYTTLSILMKDRIFDGDIFNYFEAKVSDYNSYDKFVSTIIEQPVNTLIYLNVDNDQDKFFEFLDKEVYETLPSNYKSACPDIVKYISSSFDPDSKKNKTIRMYRNTDEKKAVIICSSEDRFRLYHGIQFSLYKLLTWVFKKYPLTEFEKSLILSITDEDTSDNYISIVDKYSSDFKLKALIYSYSIKELVNKQANSRLDHVKMEIESSRGKINDLYKTIREQSLYMQKLQVSLCGLENIDLNDNANEFLDYLNTNKQIEVIDINEKENSITYYINQKLFFCDIDTLELYLSQKGSHIYKVWNEKNNIVFNSHDEIKRFFLGGLRDNEFSINTFAKFRLHFDDLKLGAINENNPHSRKNCIQHPHLGGRWTCLGDNEEVIIDALTNYDYVGAIIASNNAMTNINITDSATTKGFVNTLLDVHDDSTNCKFIEMPDGERLTLTEWLNKYVRGVK